MNLFSKLSTVKKTCQRQIHRFYFFPAYNSKMKCDKIEVYLPLFNRTAKKCDKKMFIYHCSMTARWNVTK